MIIQLPSPESPGSRSRGGAGARRRMRQQEPWTAQTHDRTPAEDAARHAQWLRSRAAATVPDAFHAQALREADRIRVQEQAWRDRLDREIRIADLPQEQAQLRAAAQPARIAYVPRRVSIGPARRA